MFRLSSSLNSHSWRINRINLSSEESKSVAKRFLEYDVYHFLYKMLRSFLLKMPIYFHNSIHFIPSPSPISKISMSLTPAVLLQVVREGEEDTFV